ncbi:MAG TPA: hypothetical protein VGQ37_07690 [Vicinamibacterales bacterium]|nr:hypothetical protein [Vicinamibacterales bacterium]
MHERGGLQGVAVAFPVQVVPRQPVQLVVDGIRSLSAAASPRFQRSSSFVTSLIRGPRMMA